MVEETGQPYPYTRDDPVNESDPNGLLGLPDIVHLVVAGYHAGLHVYHSGPVQDILQIHEVYKDLQDTYGEVRVSLTDFIELFGEGTQELEYYIEEGAGDLDQVLIDLLTGAGEAGAAEPAGLNCQ